MNRKYGHIVIMAMAALIGLLGCSRSSGGDDLLEPPTPIPTPTPTPTPEPEPTPDDDETPISFTSGVTENEVVTRATTPLSETGIHTFKVWGYKNTALSEGNYTAYQEVMPGYTVNWVGESATATPTNPDGWEYVNQQTGSETEQSVKYWDWNAVAYRFFGAYKGSGEYAATGNLLTSGGVTTYEIAFPVNALNIGSLGYFTPLWFSDGNLARYPDKQFGQPVKLEFMKPYSRVRFMFTYAYPREGIEIDPGSITFKPLNGSKISRAGSVTVIYPLTGTQTKESYKVICTNAAELPAFTENYDPDNASKEYKESDNGWYNVMPNNTQGSYTLTLTYGGEARSVTVPEAYMQWLPGYSYTYIFKVTEEGGVEIDLVQSAIRDWTEPADIRYELYNW